MIISSITVSYMISFEISSLCHVDMQVATIKMIMFGDEAIFSWWEIFMIGYMYI